ncbi:unnamed protein product [Sphagnum jensenii]|uniref:Uncharacterized protein n=1 Tax=Sphagnum jensenii TaxID=128206 RepID=A0ABP1BMA5_9BRYO
MMLGMAEEYSIAGAGKPQSPIAASSHSERDAVEHEARAHKDRRVLEEALQRNKEEVLLLARARDMRARLIEQM